MNPFVRLSAIATLMLCALGFGTDALLHHQFGTFFLNATHLVASRVAMPPLMYVVPEKINATTQPWLTTQLESCGQVQVPLADQYELEIATEKCIVAGTTEGSARGHITFVPLEDRRKDGKDQERAEFMTKALAEIQGPSPDGRPYSQVEAIVAAFNLTPRNYSLMDSGSVGLAKFVLLNQKKFLLSLIGTSHWVQYRIGKLFVIEGESPTRAGEHIALFGNADGPLYQAQYTVESEKFRGFLAALDNPPVARELAGASNLAHPLPKSK